MGRFSTFRRAPKSFVVGIGVGLALAVSGIVAAGNITPPTIITPKSEDQVANVDIARSEIKNYYGTPGASTGATAVAPAVPGWTLPLNMDSYYSAEAEGVAKQGGQWLDSQSGKYAKPAVVFDVDDTTLTTWDYELYSNWDYNPPTNTSFVGGSGASFTGNIFPATPGMVDLANRAVADGYAVFFITGRGDSQHNQTIANLVSDTAAGYSDQTTVTLNGYTVPEVDAAYPMPTALDTGHGGFTDGLFTKPAVHDYPTYLDQPQFCATAIANNASCATIAYKSGTRAYIESQGYTIVGNFGDQFSDLIGGFSVKTFKMPNPNYYLP